MIPKSIGLVAVLVLLLGACSDDSATDDGGATTTTGDSTTTTSVEEEALVAPGEVPIQATSDLPDELQAELADAVVTTMEEVGIAGASVQVVTADGSWEAVAGWSDLESGDPVVADMSWPIRSVTKSFVVTALLRLVDDGQLALDDTVDQHLDGVPDGERITLRMLADMGSGLGDYTNSDELREILVTDPTYDFTLEELNGFGYAQPVEFEPGAERSYSNTNTNVLGAVLQEVTGQPIGQVLDEQVFQPLELTGTVYEPQPYPDPTPDGYFPDEGGWVTAPVSYTGLGPSGGIVSTPADLRTWAVALATGELISPEVQADRLADAQPLVEGPVYDVYGLGIGRLGSFWGHTGQGLGYTALVMHDPGTGVTIVVNANVSESDPQPMDALFDAIAPIVASA